MKYVTIYLSDTLIIHHKITVGISGIQYFSIETATPFSNLFGFTYLYSFAVNVKKITEHTSDAIIATIYPVTPHLNGPRNKIVNNKVVAVEIIPSIANSFT